MWFFASRICSPEYPSGSEGSEELSSLPTQGDTGVLLCPCFWIIHRWKANEPLRLRLEHSARVMYTHEPSTTLTFPSYIQVSSRTHKPGCQVVRCSSSASLCSYSIYEHLIFPSQVSNYATYAEVFPGFSRLCALNFTCRHFM